MKLYLIQHALSKSKQEDSERALTDKGIDEITKTVKFLAEHISINLKSIYHSGKLRAKQTAEIIEEYLTPADAIKISVGLKPLDKPSIFAEKLKYIEENIAIVGHLPHLEKLCSYLICKDETVKTVNFKNAGIVCLNKKDGNNWVLEYIIVPELLKDR
ncbi:MAG: phosphohistidine phosphatase SixA [Promethearchaeota archaeon]